MTDVIQVQTTTAERQDAEHIASRLVGNSLAACVQVSGPITSTYRWKGDVESSQEWLCTIKTRRDLFEQVEKTIREIHPYEQPEILAVAVVAGSKGYLSWLNKELETPAE